VKISDITIGQYFPGNSPVHRIDPRVKLTLTMVYVVMLFVARNLLAMSVGVVFVLLAYLLARISLRLIVRSVKPILPIIIFTAVINLFFVGGEPLWEIWVLTVTHEGVRIAIQMCVRILCLVAGTALLTYTTSPIALTDGIELLFAPLKRLGAPVHEIAMMMTISLRFIPTLIEETEKIMSAQKARGADLESGNIFQRVRAMLPILIPLFVSAFRRADELALAMESRCYHGGEGRTRMRVLKTTAVDFFAVAFMVICLAAVIWANIMGPVLAQMGLFL